MNRGPDSFILQNLDNDKQALYIPDGPDRYKKATRDGSVSVANIDEHAAHSHVFITISDYALMDIFDHYGSVLPMYLDEFKVWHFWVFGYRVWESHYLDGDEI